MLERLRESSRSGLTMVLFAIIIVVFAISFGAPMDGCQQSTAGQRFATAAGSSLTREEVGILSNRQGSARDADQGQLALEYSYALKALAAIHLLAERAEALGFAVSDDELRDYLADPYRNLELLSGYARNNKLDRGILKRYVENRLRVSVPQYLDFKRRELLARKYLELADLQVPALGAEIEELRALTGTTVDLALVLLEPSELSEALEPTEADVAAYLADHDDELRAAYEEAKQKRFTQPEKLQIRTIYIAKPADAPEPLEVDEGEVDKLKEARQQAAEKFAEAKRRVIEESEDFGQIASELSEDFYKSKQGLMEYTSVENLDEQVTRALEGAAIGTVEPVETEFAYRIVKLEGRKPAEVTPYEEAREVLAREALSEERVSGALAQVAADLAERAKASDSLEDALESARAEAKEGSIPAQILAALTVRSTGPFARASARAGLGQPWDDVPGLGRAPAFKEAAFEATSESPVIGPLPIGDLGALAVGVLTERKEASVDEAAEAQIDAERDIRARRLSALLGNANAIFTGGRSQFGTPVTDFGPLIESMLIEAMRSGRLTFNEKVEAARLLRDRLKEAAQRREAEVAEPAAAPEDDPAPSPAP